jgi:hypothetical protein
MNLYVICIFCIKRKKMQKKNISALEWLGLTGKVMVHFIRVDVL